eukprot:COSAG01_NODE_37135_length_508_cov_0.633252_1_plen_128_part_01
MPLFEVPTGWKYFGNLMDKEQYTPLICGEESFGTSSDHVREKDGMWATLAWVSLLAARNAELEEGAALVGVGQVMQEHWREHGRHYYLRYDYEGLERYNPTLLTHYFSATFRPFCAVFSPFFRGFRLP